MSLILAILGILLSASEVTVLDLLGLLPLPPPSHAYALSSIDGIIDKYRPLLMSPTTAGTTAQHYVPRWKMVFTWQAPVMFMSYSVCAFLGGLTILVCTPFIRHEREWGSGHNVRIPPCDLTRCYTWMWQGKCVNMNSDCCHVSYCVCRRCYGVCVLLVLGVPLCGC